MKTIEEGSVLLWTRGDVEAPPARGDVAYDCYVLDPDTRTIVVATFGITVDNPARVDRACLIGIGAVTHHVDYGQRYLELMIDKTNPPVGNVEVLMPDLPPLAPEGFYLFFVVDEKSDGLHMPSEGRFVKVTFGS
jgi:hypothetical protein